MGFFKKNLPYAAKAENGVLLVHGGIPVKAAGLGALISPSDEIRTELVWNDPSERILRDEPSGIRGVGHLFGKETFEEVMEKFGSRVLIRAHEQRVASMFDGHLLTVSSTDYKNKQRGWVEFDLGKKISSAKDLEIKISYTPRVEVKPWWEDVPSPPTD